MFTWHVDANPKPIDRGLEISSMSVDEIIERAGLGDNLLRAIRTADEKFNPDLLMRFLHLSLHNI